MDTSGPSDLRWTCPRCGYALRVAGPLDTAFDLFLQLADEHIDEACGA